MNKFNVGDMVVLKARKVGKVYGELTLYPPMIFKDAKVITHITSEGKFIYLDNDRFVYTPQMLKLYTTKEKKL